MSKTGLFAPEAPRVWTIPPGIDFLGGLAATLAEEFDLKDNPAALADALIYVPNRRSARNLALALHKQAGGKPFCPLIFARLVIWKRKSRQVAPKRL